MSANPDKPPAKPGRPSTMLIGKPIGMDTELKADRAFMWTVLAAMVAVIVIMVVTALNTGPHEPEPCSRYADTPVRSLPARCAAYYGLTGTGGMR